METQVNYSIVSHVDVHEFIDLLNRSGLAERRPVDDLLCMEEMVKFGNLMVTARVGSLMVGIARSLTDFHYACYLSELAVDRHYQTFGIGTELQKFTQQQLNKHCRIIVIAAPDADGYYGRLGYVRNERCWVMGRQSQFKK